MDGTTISAGVIIAALMAFLGWFQAALSGRMNRTDLATNDFKKDTSAKLIVDATEIATLKERLLNLKNSDSERGKMFKDFHVASDGLACGLSGHGRIHKEHACLHGKSQDQSRRAYV